MNIISIYNKFKSQEDCIKHLELTRWNGIATCPYCNSKKSHKNKGENRHYCHTCKTSYCVTVGTIFHNTKLPLQKWFLAISLIINAKKGIASRQLARDLEVTKDTAWRMQMQIRKAMVEMPSLMTGIVEMDETYIGGKPKKKSDNNGNFGSDGSNNTNNSNNSSNNTNSGAKLKRGRGTTKTPVVGCVSRDGRVNAKVMHRLTFKDLKDFASANIDFDNAVLFTDDYRAYIPFKSLIKHESVNHSKKQYVKDGYIHTNTIEGFWALLKRGITGQYHYLSDKHLNKYIQEFCFKYNNRYMASENVFANVLNNAVFN